MPFLIPGFKSDLPDAILRMAQAARVNSELMQLGNGQNNFAANQLAQMKMNQEAKQQQWANQFALKQLASQQENQANDWGLRARGIDVNQQQADQTATDEATRRMFDEKKLAAEVKLKEAEIEKKKTDKEQTRKMQELTDVETNVKNLEDAVKHAYATGDNENAYAIEQELQTAQDRANALRVEMQRQPLSATGRLAGLRAEGTEVARIQSQKETQQTLENKMRQDAADALAEQRATSAKNKAISEAESERDKAVALLQKPNLTETESSAIEKRLTRAVIDLSKARGEPIENQQDYVMALREKAVATGLASKAKRENLVTMDEARKLKAEALSKVGPEAAEAVARTVPTYRLWATDIAANSYYNDVIKNPNASENDIKASMAKLVAMKNELQSGQTKRIVVLRPANLVTGEKEKTDEQLTAYGQALKEHAVPGDLTKEIDAAIRELAKKNELMKRASFLSRPVGENPLLGQTYGGMRAARIEALNGALRNGRFSGGIW